jgi:2-dehydropantoate 2-reductase
MHKRRLPHNPDYNEGTQGMGRKIAVLGSGAIGSSVGADLTRAELDVTIFDQWPEHVESMKTSGLHIQMMDGDLKIQVRAAHLCELASMKEEFDIIFLVVKSYDTRWMTELIKPYLKSDGVLVGVQNSMNNEAIASIVGPERTVGCVVELSAEIYTPGLVQRNTTRKGSWFSVGEIDGSITPRIEEIRNIMSNVGVTEITTNISGAKWTKLISNVMTMGPKGILGYKNDEAHEFPGLLDIQVNLGKESMTVGTELGYNIEPIFGLDADDFAGSDDQVLITTLKTLTAHVGIRARTAPIQDFLKGRKTEMDYINGLVSIRGREVGVPTPYNDAISEISRKINNGELKMDRSNYTLLKEMISNTT